MKQEFVRDIFKSKDGKEVRPPEAVEELLKADDKDIAIVAAVDRYLDSLGCDHENFTGNVEQWGGCPECHENHGYYFWGKQVWFVCHRHRLAWAGDYGLNSSWENMTDEYLKAQKLLLAFGFAQIKEPWFPTVSFSTFYYCIFDRELEGYKSEFPEIWEQLEPEIEAVVQAKKRMQEKFMEVLEEKGSLTGKSGRVYIRQG